MSTIATKRLSATIGAEVVDVDLDLLLHDEQARGALLEALEENGVLVFRELGLDDDALIAFSRCLGELVAVPSHPIPEITTISLDPENPLAEYFRGAFEWHIDGATSEDATPCKAGVLTAHVMTADDGGTEFASTYAACDDLTDDEKERYRSLRVLHTMEATQRRIYPDPTPEQLADWASRPQHELPLIWEHRSGRHSLVYGATADHIVGMDLDEGRALLRELLDRGTRPDRVYRHDWAVGDVVVWDNRGVIHRAAHYESTSPRELHRTTIKGDESIK